MDLDALLARLTLEQKASLTAGADLWSVPGVPEHGIPTIRVTDGPNGARGGTLPETARASALCVPCGSGLGATWDPVLVQEVGVALGDETRTKGARALLAPTVNLPRNPLAGRNFECYAEDPLLSGRIAAGFIRGVQSRGVAATIKHLVGNEAEFERTTISSDISERALRELYLLPFEIAVREAGVMAVMTSYNRVNGTWCAEDRWLLEDVLRGEWGFDGVVMSDWYAVGSTVGSAVAGLDLQMPGPGRFYGLALASAVTAGDVPEAALDAIARRWLSLIDRLDAWEDEPVEPQAVDLPEHRALARRAAADGTVLLSNSGLLPLSGMESVALIGPNALRPQVSGGGSAQLRPHRVVALAEVLRERLGDRVVCEPGCTIDKTVRPLPISLTLTFQDAEGSEAGYLQERSGLLVWLEDPFPGLGEFTFRARGQLPVTEAGTHLFRISQAGRARLSVAGNVVFDGFAEVPGPGSGDLFGFGSAAVDVWVELDAGSRVEVVVDYSTEGSSAVRGVQIAYQPPEPADLMERAVAAAAVADVAVVVVGTTDEWESEGYDRADLLLPGRQDELVRRVCAANPRTVVIVNAGAPVQLDWAEQPAALLMGWLGGQEMAPALADVLFGEAEPAGRLPVTMPLRIEHTPAFGAFPGENHHVSYAEDLLVGYRWYDSRYLPVAFPFGHGGSYTSFSWSEPRVVGSGVELTVEVEVTNTGQRRGAEVVQLYIEPPTGPLFRPQRELKGFAKLWLEPGQTATASILLDQRSFACWDPGSSESAHLAARLGDGAVVPASTTGPPRAESGWRVLDGTHQLHLARSISDVVKTCQVTIG